MIPEGPVLPSLAAARSPWCLERDLSREVARRDDLQRVCASIAAFPGKPPRLRPEPLLGACLPELTAPEETIPPAGPAPRMAHPDGAPVKPAPDKRRGHVEESCPPTPAPRPDIELPPPLPPKGMPRRSPPGLLSHLAGPIEARPARPITPAVLKVSPRHLRPLPQIGPSEACSGLREALVADARRLLRPPFPNGAQRDTGREQRDESPAPAAREEDLSRQWAAPLTGETATRDLLSLTATVPNPRDVGTAGSPEPASRATHPAAPLPTTERQPVRTELAPSDSRLFPLREIERSGREHREVPMPVPTLARPLPPLEAPQHSYTPVLPIATLTVREGAQIEAAAEDDLDVLASKIKRILDEEARRYGIDV